MDSKRAHEILFTNPEVRKARQRNLIAREVAKSVARARRERGLTQTELAALLGTKQSSIARLEKGAAMPSLVFLQKIAEALNDTLLPPTFASQSQAKIGLESKDTRQAHVDYGLQSDTMPDYKIGALS